MPEGIARNDFSRRIAVVTGGGQGIGAASAWRLLEEGARVAVLDLDCSPLETRLAENPALQARCLLSDGDCTDARVMADFFARVERDLGAVDILFSNVGQSARACGGPFADSEEATWRFVLEVSLLTAMRAARIVAPGMRARGFGRIVNMSSDAALAGDVGLADYAAAKLGVVGFTRSLARELAPHGVTVNAVCPGAIRTRAHEGLKPEVLQRVIAGTPAGFVGAPEDVAAAVTFLVGDEARYITGQTLLIDGGRWMI